MVSVEQALSSVTHQGMGLSLGLKDGEGCLEGFELGLGEQSVG